MLKRDELLVKIATEEQHMIVITETWANNNDLMSEFSVIAYEIFHKNGEHKKGGEYIYYFRNTFNAIKIEKTRCREIWHRLPGNYRRKD